MAVSSAIAWHTSHQLHITQNLRDAVFDQMSDQSAGKTLADMRRYAGDERALQHRLAFVKVSSLQLARRFVRFPETDRLTTRNRCILGTKASNPAGAKPVRVGGDPMKTSDGPPRLTVAISTRNRPDELCRAFQSLLLLTPMALEILVVDDASDDPIELRLRDSLGEDFPWPVRIIRHDVSTGYITARNEMARGALAPFIMSLDDDAWLVDAPSVHRAISLIEADPSIGAIAFTQLKTDGRPFHYESQPGPVDYDCQVASFLGYAHIVRKELFLRLGGYRELFWYYGEEIEFCKRLLASGFKVIYLPSSRVVHASSPLGRNELIRMRYGCRNACLDAMYNEPLLRMLASVPARIVNYARWRKVPIRYYGLDDRGGLYWIIGQLLRDAKSVWRERKALTWSTYRRWKRLRMAPVAYTAPSTPDREVNPIASAGG